MSLSPHEIRNSDFNRRLRGYDPNEVDAYLSALSQQVAEQNEELRRRDERLTALEVKLQHYERVEEALQQAIETARESSRQAMATAEAKAEQIRIEAHEEARGIKRDAETERLRLRQETQAIAARRKEIVARLRAFLMSEMEMLAHFEGEDPVGFIRLMPPGVGQLPAAPSDGLGPPLVAAPERDAAVDEALDAPIAPLDVPAAFAFDDTDASEAVAETALPTPEELVAEALMDDWSPAPDMLDERAADATVEAVRFEEETVVLDVQEEATPEPHEAAWIDESDAASPAEPLPLAEAADVSSDPVPHAEPWAEPDGWVDAPEPVSEDAPASPMFAFDEPSPADAPVWDVPPPSFETSEPEPEPPALPDEPRPSGSVWGSPPPLEELRIVALTDVFPGAATEPPAPPPMAFELPSYADPEPAAPDVPRAAAPPSYTAEAVVLPEFTPAPPSFVPDASAAAPPPFAEPEPAPFVEPEPSSFAETQWTPAEMPTPELPEAAEPAAWTPEPADAPTMWTPDPAEASAFSDALPAEPSAETFDPLAAAPSESRPPVLAGPVASVWNDDLLDQLMPPAAPRPAAEPAAPTTRDLPAPPPVVPTMVPPAFAAPEAPAEPQASAEPPVAPKTVARTGYAVESLVGDLPEAAAPAPPPSPAPADRSVTASGEEIERIRRLLSGLG